MKNIFILITCLILIESCTKKIHDHSGIYYAQKPDIIIRGFNYYFLNTIFSNREQLILNKDSTYFQTNYCMEWKGKWTVGSDNLFLNCKEKLFVVDSFNHLDHYKEFRISSAQPEKLLIKKNKLISESKTEKNTWKIIYRKKN